MSKIRRISELGEDANHSLGFYEYWAGFLSSDLGQIYQAIPWSKLVSVWGIGEKAFGPSSYFPPAGKIALMFLKHYSCCSDERLISQLNGNFHYQFFCGIWIDPTDPLEHRQLVSSIRTELSQSLPIDGLQQVLASHWKAHMSEPENLLCDATCYESEVRYPTDPKLLWECVSWLHGQLRLWHKSLGLRMPRTKHSKWVKVYGSYRRKRKPRVKQRKRVIRGTDSPTEEVSGDHKRAGTGLSCANPSKGTNTASDH